MRNIVEFDRVSIVFGEAQAEALALMDQGLSREEIKNSTGAVAGVHNASLTVKEGEILVLMGLSGSGKSTLLRVVNGLLPVARGEVRLRHRGEMVPVGSASEASLRAIRRESVGMVFQQFALLPWRSVAENVGFGLELAGVPEAERRTKVEEQLALVGLEGWGGRKVSELSGGMQQRVGLARAFASDAPLLLLDEPFSALDPLIRNRLQNELLELQARLKRTMIFVSHDLDEAFRIGSRIALMEGGRLVQAGTAAEIVANPATSGVAEFVAHMNPLDILCARDLANPALQGEGEPLEAATPIRAVMGRLLSAEAPVPVLEQGALLGAVDPRAVLARLVKAA